MARSLRSFFPDRRGTALAAAAAAWLSIAPGGAIAGITDIASVSTSGHEGDGISGRIAAPVLSADGAIGAFDSEAKNLIPVDANGSVVDVFVHDRVTGTTVVASVSSAAVQGDKDSSEPSLSGDGRFVAFQSNATNLVPGDTNVAM